MRASVPARAGATDHTGAAGPPRSDLRPEIQGLRALAVALVVAFHLWPGALPGGYLGVDVFFVVSGFLIGGHLLRELDATGRVRLARFWTRRARRLLPAATTVLVACLAVVHWRVPEPLQGRWFHETEAAAWYGLNWVLAQAAVLYSASDQSSSPAQHYWSLSVEEQFYLTWPVLMLAAAWVARRLHRTPHRAVVVVTSVVLVASFAWSVRESFRTPAAYFVTTTRVWEFAAGALLAAAGASVRLPRRAAVATSLLGAGTIVATSFLLGAGTAFPGWVAAVPVAATLLVVAAGDPGGRAWYRPVAVQRLGDWSYAAYLWHWPLLVLAPYLTRHPLTTAERFAVPVVTVVLAALTKRFVEDPVRRLRVGPRGTWTTALAVAASVAGVVLVAQAGTADAARTVARWHAQDRALDVAGVACLGAAAGVTGPCDDPRVAGRVTPRPAFAFDDSVRYCLTGNTDSAVSMCEFGVPLDQAKHVVALVGDSHGAQWQAAFEVLAREKGWHVYTFFRGSCQLADTPRAADPVVRAGCAAWNANVLRALAGLPRITTLVTTGKAGSEFEPGAAGSSYAAGVAGYRRTWAALPPSVTDVWVIRDTPQLGRDARQCLLLLDPADLLGPDRCGTPRDVALEPDPGIGAVLPLEGASSGRRYHHVDLDDLLCTPTRCPAVIGHVVVYRDTHHLTATFARTLVPYLEQRLDLDRGRGSSFSRAKAVLQAPEPGVPAPEAVLVAP